jgi:hypothetical protein
MSRGAAAVIFAAALLLLLSLQGAHASSPPAPAVKLRLEPLPQVLPADGRTYPALIVELVDSSGNPVIATQDVVVYLSSSRADVGSVPPSTTIRLGSFYALVNFTTTTVVGSAPITASSPGLLSSTATISTAKPSGYPSRIKVVASPEVLRPGMQGYVLIEVLDEAGSPAPSVSRLAVSLNTSNPSILQLPSSQLLLEEGRFLAVGTYQTGFVPGSALITAGASGFSPDTAQVTVLGPTPFALSMAAQPPVMAACRPPIAPQACAGRLVITLTDLDGRPVKAPQDIQVTLVSSNTSVALVPASVTIPKGEIYAAAQYQTTPQEGSATITASAMGLRSAITSVQTFSPSSRPVRLALYSAPEPLLADNRAYHSLLVALQDEQGRPAVANGTVEVHLTSSDTSIVSLAGSASIASGYATSSVVDLMTTFLPGTASITASAKDLLPSQLRVSTFGPVASNIALRVVTSDLPANGGRYKALEVMLLDSSGLPAVASNPGIAVSLFSSRTDVISVSPTVLINAGESFALVDVATSAIAGESIVTVVANFANHTAVASTYIRTFSPSPSRLALFVVPSQALLTKATPSALLAVQLQDEAGNPAKARRDTAVLISSSNASILPELLNVTIPQAQSYALLALSPQRTGVALLTAISPGLSPSSASLTVRPLAIQASISANPQAIYTNQTAALQLTLTFQGVALEGANVTWTSSSGVISPKASRTGQEGVASAQFTPSQPGFVSIVAQVTHPAFGSVNVTGGLTVFEPVPPPPSKPLLLRLLSFPYLLLWPLPAAAAVAVYLLRRRRGEGEEAEELP